MLGLTMPATKTRLFRAQHRMRSALRRSLVIHIPTKTTSARARRSTASTCIPIGVLTAASGAKSCTTIHITHDQSCHQYAQ